MTDLLVRLYDLPDPTYLIKQLAGEGIHIRRAMAFEKAAVTDWVQQYFGREWASECDVTFSNHPISCFLAVQNGALAGFACFEGICKNFFGPTGVLGEARGHGIGKALLLACLHAMRDYGYAYAIIGAAGPQEFYARAVSAVEIPNSTPGIYPQSLKSR